MLIALPTFHQSIAMMSAARARIVKISRRFGILGANVNLSKFRNMSVNGCIRLLVSFVSVLLTDALTVAETSLRPNIVYMLADDLGWSDFSAHGGRIVTPHIDRLFQQGVELRNFMGGASVRPPGNAADGKASLSSRDGT